MNPKLEQLANQQFLKMRVNQLLDQKYGEAMAQFKQRNNLQNVAWDAIEICV